TSAKMLVASADVLWLRKNVYGFARYSLRILTDNVWLRLHEKRSCMYSVSAASALLITNNTNAATPANVRNACVLWNPRVSYTHNRRESFWMMSGSATNARNGITDAMPTTWNSAITVTTGSSR